MLKKYLPAIAALILYPLAYLWNDAAFLCLALAWTALIYWGESDNKWYIKFGIGLLAFALASIISGESYAILQSLAWLAYLLARPLWGKQRAFLGLIFLFLTAEALPFYVSFVEDSFSLALSSAYPRPLGFWAPWYYEAGQFAASFQIILSGLFGFFIIRQAETRKKPALILLVLSIIIIFAPLIFNLSVDEYRAETAIQNLAWGMSKMDRFIARLSFFLAFFLLLFAAVRKLLPEKNADDRFT